MFFVEKSDYEALISYEKYCCTGMSDLCSPMVILFENEADAFWCFERLMRRLVSLVCSDNFSLGFDACRYFLLLVDKILVE